MLVRQLTGGSESDLPGDVGNRVTASKLAVLVLVVLLAMVLVVLLVMVLVVLLVLAIAVMLMIETVRVVTAVMNGSGSKEVLVCCCS